MYTESDPKVIKVLEVALSSSSRVVRLRAVCMLANVDFEQRAEWLAAACLDADASVRQAASAVTSWTLVRRATAVAGAGGPGLRPRPGTGRG